MIEILNKTSEALFFSAICSENEVSPRIMLMCFFTASVPPMNLSFVVSISETKETCRIRQD